MNNLDDPSQRTCSECGHRADLPRAECDCAKCKPTPEQREQQRAEQKRLDRLSMVYLTAIDAGDFDTIDKLYADAETDPPLLGMLHGLNAVLGREDAAGAT